MPLRSRAVFAGRVTGAIESIRSVRGKATAPGEISGPALQFDVVLRNGSARRLDLSDAVVTLAYGPQRTPAGELTGPPADPLPAVVRAGGSASGRYVFQVPSDQQDSELLLYLSYSPSAPAVRFVGRR